MLEKDGAGLNLTYETRMAVLHHSKPRGDFLNGAELDALSLEAQIVRVGDAVAYLAHDIGDAVRAGVLGETDLPTDAASCSALATRSGSIRWSATSSRPRGTARATPTLGPPANVRGSR